MRRSSRRRTERGSTLVEFGLVFPLVITLLLAVVQYGYHFWALSQASAVAREVARLQIVNTQWACSQTWGIRQASLPSVAVPTVSRTFPAGGGPRSNGVVPEGTRIRVTVAFRSFYLGMFPLPNHGMVSESADARIEYAPSLVSGGNAPQACPAEYR